MRSYYPGSFLKLIFVGFSLVAIPPIFALIANAVSVDRLAKQSQRAVHEAVQATNASRLLIEQIVGMERSARQYLVLGDPALRENYVAAHEKFAAAAEKLATLPGDETQQALLEGLLSGEQALFEKISSVSAFPSQISDAPEEFATLLDLARTIVKQRDALVEREVDAMQAMAGKAEQVIVWQMLSLIPVALFLVVGFTVLIAKPIRQIDEAIRRLGDGKFNEPVTVEGPQDLVYLGKRLDWMRQRLIELEEQKTRFLRHISHELKTPLTTLREGAELLNDEVAGPLNMQQKEIAEILRKDSLELQKLIEGLLTFHAVQFQKFELRLTRIRLRSVLAHVAGNHRLAMMSKGIKLELACPNLMLYGDEEKIGAIVDNLFSNAIKFTPQDGTIRLAVWREGDHMVLEMADSGPGIAEEDRDKIFDAFYQGRAEHAGPLKGTGLGLAIVREYVYAHHGAIEVVNGEDGGAHFKVTLPLKRPEMAA